MPRVAEVISFTVEGRIIILNPAVVAVAMRGNERPTRWRTKVRFAKNSLVQDRARTRNRYIRLQVLLCTSSVMKFIDRTTRRFYMEKLRHSVVCSCEFSRR